MNGILDFLESTTGQTITSGISKSSNIDQDKTTGILSMAMPVLLKAMERNSSTSEGAEGLLGAIKKKHDGSILDDLGGFFGGGVDNNVINDGSKILGHVLGAKQSGIEQVIGDKVGVDSSSVSNILKMATPLLMGVLGKEAKQNNINSQNDLGGLLSGFLTNNSSNNDQNFLEKLLDADGDGSMIDDVAGALLGGSKGKGGIGGLIGGLFRK